MFFQRGRQPLSQQLGVQLPVCSDLLLSSQGSECFLCKPKPPKWKFGLCSRGQAVQFEGFQSFTVSKGRSALHWAALSFLAPLSPMQKPKHNSHATLHWAQITHPAVLRAQESAWSVRLTPRASLGASEDSRDGRHSVSE